MFGKYKDFKWLFITEIFLIPSLIALAYICRDDPVGFFVNLFFAACNVAHVAYAIGYVNGSS